ncbi:MAG: NF038122 family metalloprotease [Cyanobacteria bacterium P01_F01_bin.116]
MVQFNFTYDPGISVEQRTGFELAARIWGAYLTDDIAVNLHICSVDSLEGNAIGGAVPFFHEQNYGVFNEYLENDATLSTDANNPSIDDQALDSLQDGNTVDVIVDGEIIDGNSQILLTSAQAKALGMDEALALDNGTTWDRDLVDANALDGYIVINQSYDWSYDFLREGTAPESTLDFLTLAMHEIGHQLGFVSGLDGMLDVNQLYSGETQVDGFTLLDLFRHTTESSTVDNPDGAVSDLTLGANAYFSVDGGTSELGLFSTGQSGDGFQAGHWKRMQDALGIMDPTLAYQERLSLTELDLQALDALGYDVNYEALNNLDFHALLQQAELAVVNQLEVDTGDNSTSGDNSASDSGTTGDSGTSDSDSSGDSDTSGDSGIISDDSGENDDSQSMTDEQWWQIFEDQLSSLGWNDWWQILDLGFGLWFQQFGQSMIEQGYGRWWQILEQQLSQGWDTWFQQLEETVFDLGFGKWWQLLDIGGGTWWQELEPFFLTLDASDGDIAETISTADSSEIGHITIEVLQNGELDNIIAGDDNQNQIYAGAGDDLIDGKAGDDELWGEAGRDIIYGHHGNDQIYGGDDDDVLMGEADDDTLHGGAGHDILSGGEGNDVLTGDEGHDDLRGGAGDDILSGNADNDRLEGNAGDDILIGGEGHDEISGGSGDDIILGDAYAYSDQELLNQLRQDIQQSSSSSATTESSTTSESTTDGVNPLRIEAENMTLSGNYKTKTDWSYDSGASIATYSSATATTLFTGESGQYMVVVRYFQSTDDDDDYGSLSVSLNNGQASNSWNLGQDTTYDNTRTVFQDITLQTGDQLDIIFSAGDDGKTALDYLDFIRLDTMIEAQLEPDLLDSLTTTDIGDGNESVGIEVNAIGNPIRMEAEAMTLSGYQTEYTSVASNNGLILTGSSGTATAAFTGDNGYYNVIVAYYDENDGLGRLSASLAGVELDNWQLNQNLGSSLPDSKNLVTRTIATQIQVQNGAILELQGLREYNEFARIDYVEFIPVSAPVSNQPPSSNGDILQGDAGNDILFGGEDNDLIYGESKIDNSSSLLKGAQTYNGHTYLLTDTNTWTEAQAYARTLGGDLVTINDTAEDQWLKNIFGTTEALWTGFSDTETEGVWKWASGEAVTYTNWTPGQPDDYQGNQDYAVLSYVWGANSDQWDDVTSNDQYRGIIEINAANNDILVGGIGNDTLYGNLGNDTLYGDDFENQNNDSLANGLIGHWRFDETTGTQAEDATGNYSGTLTNMSDSQWTTGQLGGALNFDGSNDRVVVADSAALDLTNTLTLATWVKADSFQAWDGLITKGTSTIAYGLDLNNDGSLIFSANYGSLSDASGFGDWNSDASLTTGRWHHVAVTYDGSYIRFYIDGQLDTNVVETNVTFGTSNEALVLGAELVGSHFDGALDDTRVYERALSASEITELANLSSEEGIAGDDTLVGGVGNDVLVGGAGNDSLNGTDAISVGYFEQDTLTGGSGIDTFILGDANQIYYQGRGDQDYALITDFNSVEDLIVLYGNSDNYTHNEQGNDTYLYANSDLVAIFKDTTNFSLSTGTTFA